MVDTIFLVLIAFCLMLGQLARVTLGDGVQFYLLEIIVLVHSVFLLVRTDVSSSLKSQLVRVGMLWFGYVVCLFLITVWGKSWSDNLRSGMYILRVGVFATYAVLVTRSVTPARYTKIVWDVLSLAIPALCLIQYMFLPDLRFLQQYGWDPHMYRAVGVFLDPPIIGALLAILFISAFHEKRKIAIILNYLAILFLFSRSTYLTIFVVVTLYLMRRKNWAITTYWIAICIISVWLAPMTIPGYTRLESAKIERVSTVLSRRVEIEAGIRAWLSRPIVGISYNRVAEYKAHHSEIYGDEISKSHAASAFHSFWVTQLATTGIVGILLLGYWYFLTMRKSELWFSVLLVPALIGLLDNVFFHPFVLILMVLLLNKQRNATVKE